VLALTAFNFYKISQRMSFAVKGYLFCSSDLQKNISIDLSKLPKAPVDLTAGFKRPRELNDLPPAKRINLSGFKEYFLKKETLLKLQALSLKDDFPLYRLSLPQRIGIYGLFTKCVLIDEHVISITEELDTVRLLLTLMLEYLKCTKNSHEKQSPEKASEDIGIKVDQSQTVHFMNFSLENSPPAIKDYSPNRIIDEFLNPL
jgi:hypothetical protein